MFFDLLKGETRLESLAPAWAIDLQIGIPLSINADTSTEFVSNVIVAMRFTVGLEEFLTEKGKIKRSITEDQFSVYTQVAGLFATAGMGGASCLQYIICILAQKQNGGQWAQDGGKWIQDGGQRAQDDGQWAQFDGHGAQNGSQWIKKGGHAIDGETTQNGGQSVQDGEGPVKSKTKKASEKKEENLKESSRSNKKQKKTRRTSSLISDLASTLLLPKAGHSDSLYTEAAQAALAGGGSCEQRYTGCSAAVKGVIDTLLRL